MQPVMLGLVREPSRHPSVEKPSFHPLADEDDATLIGAASSSMILNASTAVWGIRRSSRRSCLRESETAFSAGLSETPIQASN